MAKPTVSDGDEIGASRVSDSAGDECLLRTHDLRLRYGSNLVVDRLSLNVRRGEIYGFLGRNGAGKTSTIRMIMGIGVPDGGTIEFDGETFRRIGNAQKRRIGYVSQESFFYPWMTCRRIGRFVGGLFPTWDDSEYDRLMRVLDLPPDRKVSHLSGGMKVKLALALALAHRPDILILDEPTAGLDPVARREFLDIISRQAEQYGRTTFFSSHLIDEVQRVSHRVGVIRRGRLMFEGPLDDLIDQIREVPAEAEPVIEAAGASEAAAGGERGQALSLQSLGPGLDGRSSRIYRGSASDWRAAAEAGVRGTPLSPEDAFIALVRDPVAAV